jgi:hypothetical protein
MKKAGQSDAGLEKAMKKVSEVRYEFDSIRNSLIEEELEFRKSLAAKRAINQNFALCNSSSLT